MKIENKNHESNWIIRGSFTSVQIQRAAQREVDVKQLLVGEAAAAVWQNDSQNTRCYFMPIYLFQFEHDCLELVVVVV